MRRNVVKGLLAAVVIAATGFSPSAPRAAAPADTPAVLQSIGPLAFGPGEVLFAADNQGAAIYAFELGRSATGGAPGTKDVPGIDQKIAALLGTDAA